MRVLALFAPPLAASSTRIGIGVAVLLVGAVLVGVVLSLDSLGRRRQGRSGHARGRVVGYQARVLGTHLGSTDPLHDPRGTAVPAGAPDVVVGAATSGEVGPDAPPGGAGEYYPEVEFTTADGRSIRAVSETRSVPGPKVGARVTVDYSPQDPTSVRVSTAGSRLAVRGVEAAFGGFGVLLFLIGLAIVLA